MNTGRQPTDYDKQVGLRIREGRLAKRMSQKTLAGLIGVSYQQLQKYEAGSDRVPTARIDLLVSALERPLAWFFPNATDVRGNADAQIIKFITSKEGYDIANNFFRMTPAARGLVIGLIRCLATEEAQQ